MRIIQKSKHETRSFIHDFKIFCTLIPVSSGINRRILGKQQKYVTGRGMKHPSQELCLNYLILLNVNWFLTS